MQWLDHISATVRTPICFLFLSEPGGMRPILWANLFHLCASYTSHLSLRFQKNISWNPNGSVFQCFSGRGSATTADFCQLQEYLRWHNINMMSETFFRVDLKEHNDWAFFFRVDLTRTSTEVPRHFPTRSIMMSDMICQRGSFGEKISPIKQRTTKSWHRKIFRIWWFQEQAGQQVLPGEPTSGHTRDHQEAPFLHRESR